MGTTFLLFIGWLVVSVVIALIRQNPISSIYTDANAFLFLALLPAWWMLIRRDATGVQRPSPSYWRAHPLLVLKSWLIVLLFGQDLAIVTATVQLGFVTQVVGEITYINANIYRVFFSKSDLFTSSFMCHGSSFYTDRPPHAGGLSPCFCQHSVSILACQEVFWLGLGMFLSY